MREHDGKDLIRSLSSDNARDFAHFGLGLR